MTLDNDEVLEMDIVEAFEAGVDLYWSGGVPEGWNDKDANDNPYLAGWNIAANTENQTNFFAEREPG